MSLAAQPTLHDVQCLDSRGLHRMAYAQWGDPGVFLRTAYEGAWLHINEIRRVTR